VVAEENQVGIGGLNQSFLIADGTGKTAALVAKDLACHDFRGNGAAIDRYGVRAGREVRRFRDEIEGAHFASPHGCFHVSVSGD
jgi:hypothetical protein